MEIKINKDGMYSNNYVMIIPDELIAKLDRLIEAVEKLDKPPFIINYEHRPPDLPLGTYINTCNPDDSKPQLDEEDK